MKLKLSVIVSVLFSLFLISCGNHSASSAMKMKRAFYQWNEISIDKREDSLYRALDVQTVYTHFFDVDVDEPGDYPHPIDVADSWYYIDFKLNDSISVVPTIFITNQTFQKMDDSTVADLANRVDKKIKHLIHRMADGNTINFYDWYEQNPYQNKTDDMRQLARRDSARKALYESIREIQFDCDWTPSTKDKYFMFLEKMKSRFADKVISSTIRLYAYKYPEKAGVPPVEKGMLMCYNAGDVLSLTNTNSIFDKRDILSYLDAEKPYPLKLDYALPIFYWCAIYRDGKLINLLATDSFWFNDERKYRLDKSNNDVVVYEVLEEHTLGYSNNSPLLKKGDIIKIEQPNLDDVAAISSKLGSINTNPSPVVSLYHFTFSNVTRHEKAIQKIYNSF